MREEKINKLMKESLLQTTGGFTDKLMDKIEQRNIAVNFPQWSKIGMVISVVLLLIIPLIWHMLMVNYFSSSILFYIPVIIFILFVINKYFSLSEAQQTI